MPTVQLSAFECIGDRTQTGYEVCRALLRSSPARTDAGRTRQEDRHQYTPAQPHRAPAGKREHANSHPLCRGLRHEPRCSPSRKEGLGQEPKTLHPTSPGSFRPAPRQGCLRPVAPVICGPDPNSQAVTVRRSSGNVKRTNQRRRCWQADDSTNGN